jgi:hypothetical protein
MNARLAHVQRSAAPLSGPELAIARSVLYASLFEYPLSLAQLRQTLIESAQTPTEILVSYRNSPSLRLLVDYEDGYFFPAGRRDLLGERRVREQRSRAFLLRHRTLLTVIAALPFVRLVALSGSIAHLNLEGSGDLDLFIVTKGRRVWSVTVSVIVLAKLLRRRQTLCANFVLADTALALTQQDLFTASQVIHLKPLVGAETYGKLLAANPFVTRLYPNFHRALTSDAGVTVPQLPRSVKAALEWLLAVPAAAAEHLSRFAYRAYLLRRRAGWQSPDQVRLDVDCLKLHTQSHRRAIMERFEEGVRNWELGARG